MHTPNVFLAYTPRGAGLRCGVAYIASESDAYGWFTGPRQDLSVASCYFVLEELYTTRPTGYEAVDHADLHSAWPLDEARRHELAQMQEIFAREWLVYRDEPRAAAESQAYAKAELGMGELNVRFERLSRFSTLQPTWTFYSPRFEQTVLRHLAKHWPLEYRPDSGRAEEPPKRRVRRILT